MAKKSYTQQRMKKEERKTNIFWAEGAREKVLEPHVRAYAEALQQGPRQERDCIISICNEYHARIDWRLKDCEEPPLPLPPYDPKAHRFEEKLSKEEATLKAAKINEVNERIRRWMKYRARKLCKSFQSTNPKKNPYAFLLAKLSGLKSPPKARQGYQQFMHERWQDLIEPETKKRWQTKVFQDGRGIGSTPTTAFRTMVARDMFSKLPAEEQSAIKKRAQDEAKSAKELYEANLEGIPPCTPQSRQQAVDALTAFIAPIFEGLAKHTNYRFALVYGGPLPGSNDEIDSGCLCWGKTQTNDPMNWQSWDRARFENVLEFFHEWLVKTYTPEELTALQAGRPWPSLEDLETEGLFRIKDNNMDLGGDPSGFDSYSSDEEDAFADGEAEEGNERRKRPRTMGPSENSASRNALPLDKSPVPVSIPVPALSATQSLAYSPYSPNNPDGPLLEPDWTSREQMDAYNHARELRGLPKRDQAQPSDNRRTEQLPLEATRQPSETPPPPPPSPPIQDEDWPMDEPTFPQEQDIPRSPSLASSSLPLRLPPLPVPNSFVSTGPVIIEQPMTGVTSATANHPEDVSAAAPSALRLSSAVWSTPSSRSSSPSSNRPVPPSPDTDSSTSNPSTSPSPSTTPEVPQSTPISVPKPTSVRSVIHAVPLCPESAPAWFQEVYDGLTATPLNDALYYELLRDYMALESSYMFANPRGSKSLSRTNRPDILSSWIAGQRFRRRVQPEIDDPISFARLWWTWWDSLSPKWVSYTNNRKPKVYPANQDQWYSLRLPGPNGFLSLVVSLYWWRCAIKTTVDRIHVDMLGDWQSAVSEPGRKGFILRRRLDLANAWVHHEFGVNPKNNYRITSFVNGNEDINGLCLQLDHIQDPTLRPLDELFADHFMQGLLKHVKGTGESTWTYEEYDDVFGEGSNLSNPKIWGTREGKERFELAIADRLFDHQLSAGRT